MKCPACSNELSPVTVDGLTVDSCKDNGCGGLFFDHFQLKKVDEPTELAGDKLVELQKQEAKKTVSDEKRNCPKCDNQPMMRHFFSVKREVLVDECPGCGGMWLDAGELDKIRKEFSSDAARETATEKYFDETFDPSIAQFQAEEKRESVGKMGRLFKFFSRNKN